jgi:hypothetical protein
MLKIEVKAGKGGRVILIDSITQVAPEDARSIVIAASHGGTSSGEFALEVPLKAVFFNDAGVGKDNAGIAALVMLEANHVAAGTVAHTSARIGDSRDMWEHGVISHVNPTARALGLVPGQALRRALTDLLSG